MGADLPAGAVTFLFTDVEGSTRLLRRLGELAYADVLAHHRRVLRDAFTRHGGVEVDTQGDAFFFAFPTPDGALEGARDGCAALDGSPIRVRIGVHTGTPVRTDEGYVGEDVHRAARIAASGSGGQILVSRETAVLVGRERFTLVDLGDHRFKDLDEPERVFQVGDIAFPPIRSLYRANLPVPATPFIGRSDEVADVVAMLRAEGGGLVTLTGPGGTGKTRLAIRAAAEAAGSFPDGVWWVPLATLARSALVPARIGEVLGVPEDPGDAPLEALTRRLGGKRDLIVLDNAEHLLPDVATDVATILSAVAGPTFLVTSRERLRVGAEREYRVPSMALEDAVALAVARAGAVDVRIEAGPQVEDLCRRLECLPLAIQLAAPRLSLFSLAQLSERLGSHLDSIGGDRDTDPRHATLRATIGWSYDLLAAHERAALDRLSVFVGGCTVDAAADVAGTDDAVLGALLDKSLLQRRAGDVPRLWIQVPVLAFAAERLEQRGEAERYRDRHAAWCCALAERADAAVRAGEPEEVAIAPIEPEIDNIRAAVEHAIASGDVTLVRRITVALPMYWQIRDRYAEARAWLERALELSSDEDEIRVRLLLALGAVAYRQGDHAAAIAASDGAADLAMRLGGVTDRFQDLKLRALRAWDDGDEDLAERLYAEAMLVALDADNGVGISSCRLNLASLANQGGRHDRAYELFHENLPFVRGRGQSRCEAFTLIGLAETAALEDAPDDAVGWALGAAERAEGFGEVSLMAYALDVAAAGLADLGSADAAATILGATAATREGLGIAADEDETAVIERAAAAIDRYLDPPTSAAIQAAGSTMTLGDALTVGRHAVRQLTAVP